MSNAVSTFKFAPADALIRTVLIGGAPWLVVADACRILGHSNPSVAIRVTEPHERAKSDLGGGRHATVVSESGLYKLVMRSDKLHARTFQAWVTEIVLPAIRKDGAYVMGEEKVVSGELSEDEFIGRAMQIMANKLERLKPRLWNWSRIRLSSTTAPVCQSSTTRPVNCTASTRR